jgi:hypothetical protein
MFFGSHYDQKIANLPAKRSWTHPEEWPVRLVRAQLNPRGCQRFDFFFFAFFVFFGIIFFTAFLAFLATDFAALTTRLVTDFFFDFLAMLTP